MVLVSNLHYVHDFIVGAIDPMIFQYSVVFVCGKETIPVDISFLENLIIFSLSSQYAKVYFR